MLSTAIEVQSPCTPTSSGGCGGSVTEVANILMQSVNNGSPWWVIGNAYYCKDIVLVLRNAHCTKGVRKLMYKLRGVESRVYLPDLRRVDQCHENLAVRANSDVFDPLQ